jgi:hypothetical protein
MTELINFSSRHDPAVSLCEGTGDVRDGGVGIPFRVTDEELGMRREVRHRLAEESINLTRAVTAVPTKGSNARNFARLGPARHGFRVHVEQACHLGRSEEPVGAGIYRWIHQVPIVGCCVDS